MGITLYQEKSLRDEVRPIVLEIVEEITCMLPFATTEEIGSTAIPGAITKGDIDLVVFVPEQQFDSASESLGTIFEANEMITLERFSSFKGVRGRFDLGIQLCCNDSAFEFVRFRDLLRQSQSLVEQYNAIKRAANMLGMEEFRAKKNEFIDNVLK